MADAPERPPAPVAEELLHLRRPLAMRRPAKAVPVREKARPVIPRPEIAARREALAPAVLDSLVAVPVVGQAEEKRGKRLVLVGLDVAADDALKEFGLGRKQALECREG